MLQLQQDQHQEQQDQHQEQIFNISAGSTCANNCEILVVPHKTVNLLVRDVLQKLGIHLSQTNKGEKVKNNLTTHDQKSHTKYSKNFLSYALAWAVQKPHGKINM